MSTIPSVSTVSNSSTWPAAFEASLQSLEREITSPGDDASIELAADEDCRAKLECEQQHDETCCLRCGDPTEGIRVGGSIVRICPDCRRPQVTERKFLTMYV
jgi:hypothetical protein